jgi:MFS transporter, DHA2 family, multidrug resistance protein
LLQQGMINPSPEQIALLLSGQLKTQAMSVAGVNNFQWIIFSIILLVPIMVIAMKWANNQPHHKDNESEVH